MTRIKICGITNLNDALLACELGADALGFIFTKSPRQVSPEKAKEIIINLPPFVSKVGVFKNQKISIVKEIMNYCNLDYAQFHGEEDRFYLKAFSPRVIIKVFEINNNNVIDEIKKYSIPFFMVDLPKNKGRSIHNLKIVKRVRRLGKMILAGGLSPENISKVLTEVFPYGVDVCRGVEEMEGIKSPEKLKKFILEVRRWDLQKN